MKIFGKGGTRECDEVTRRALPRQLSLPSERAPGDSGYTCPLHQVAWQSLNGFRSTTRQGPSRRNYGSAQVFSLDGNDGNFMGGNGKSRQGSELGAVG